MVGAVREEFINSGGTYGSPKIWITLVRKGWRISVNTIAKIMAELGLAGRTVRRRRGLTRPRRRAWTSCAVTSPRRHPTSSGAGT